MRPRKGWTSDEGATHPTEAHAKRAASAHPSVLYKLLNPIF
ncbi:hypothetical protein PGC35_11965 [Psychrobacillus sp. PGGUH221]